MERESPRSPEAEKIPPRNLLTNYRETLRAIAEIEGPAWLQDQATETTNTAREIFEHLRELDAETKQKASALFDLYGSGGRHRWIIRTDGTVEFSAHHAIDEEKINKARKLGFNIF